MTTDLCISFALAALGPLIACCACFLPLRRTLSALEIHPTGNHSSREAAATSGKAAETSPPGPSATSDFPSSDASAPPDELCPPSHLRHFPSAGDVVCALLYYIFFCVIQLPLFGDASSGSAAAPPSLLNAVFTVAASLAVYLPLLVLAIEHRGQGFLRLKGQAPSLRQLARLFLLSIAAVFAFSLLYQYSGLSDLILRLSGAPELQSVCELIAQTSEAEALVLMGINTILIAPVCEEILWRGYIFNILRTRCRPTVAAAISGLLFGAIHFALPQFVILSFFGFILALAYYRSRSLIMPIALHVTFNAINFTLLLT